jgi:high-affinity iron transporter
VTFVPDAALIALREGLEALLITGILWTLVVRAGRPDARRHVVGGFAAAVLASMGFAWFVDTYLRSNFEQAGYAEVFELLVLLAGVGLLAYMAFWMWNHTRRLLGETRERAEAALDRGNLLVIVGLVFASVFREGVEVALFYAALAPEHGAFDLAWSGVAGFALSGAIVYAVLRTTRNVDLERLFRWTGLYLLVVAAMLLTHVVEALTGLGVLAPQAAAWDTSHIVAGDGPLGRILHAVFGYHAAPTPNQVVAYLGFLLPVGGLYLWRTASLREDGRVGAATSPRRVAAAAFLALALVGGALGAAVVSDPGPGTGIGTAETGEAADDGPTAEDIPDDVKVGVMLRAHGEPIEYNETTYQEFADFVRKLLIQLGFEELLAIDQGTVLLDTNHPYDHEPHVDTDLVDAWLQPWDKPAAYVGSPAPERQQVPLLDGAYVAPGGPGLGEPDVLEAAGLQTYTDYLQMENDSAMHPTKAQILDRVTASLEDRFGDQVVVERAHHIRPMVNPEEESLEESTGDLLAREPDVIVDAYTSHLHSDIMNECMKEKAFRNQLEQQGWDGPVLEAGPSGLADAFAQGMADHLARKVNRYPADAKVWLSLTHHGADPDLRSQCRDRRDPYINQTVAMFEKTRDALGNRSLGPEVMVRQVYGDGAGDPDDGFYSPSEAVENASKRNATHLLDVPYELPGDGFDNLVNHRLNYDLDPRDAPHYGENYRTHLTREGVPILVTSSAFGSETRAQAQVDAIAEALAPVAEGEVPG